MVFGLIPFPFANEVQSVNKGGEQSAEKDVKERLDQGIGKDTGSSTTQNTLL